MITAKETLCVLQAKEVRRLADNMIQLGKEVCWLIDSHIILISSEVSAWLKM